MTRRYKVPNQLARSQLRECHDSSWSTIAATALLAGAGIVVALFNQQTVTAAAEVARHVLTPSKPQRPLSLRDRLVVGLKARTKAEVAFVDNVAFRVRVGQLPQRVVDETFFWARDRAGTARSGRPQRPIIYFQPAMVARAQRLNVNL